MESARFFRMFEISLKCSNYFRSSPFFPQWKTGRNSFRLVISPPLLRGCAWVLGMMGGHTLFFLAQVYLSHKSGDLGGFCFATFFFAMGVNITSSMSFFVFIPKEYAAIVNLNNDYFSNFQRTWIPAYSTKTSKINRVTDAVTFLTCFSCGVTQLLCFTHFLIFPETSIYLTSISEMSFNGVTLSQMSPIGSKVIFGFGMIFYFHFFGAVYSLILVYILAAKTYLTFIYFIVASDFRCLKWMSKSQRSLAGLRSPTQLPIQYRVLELVHGFTVSYYGPLIPITESLCANIIIIGSYMVIRHGQDLNRSAFGIVAMWSTGMLILFVLILRFGGVFFTQSKKTINSWKHWKDSGDPRWRVEWRMKYIRLFQRSCRPLALEYPGYYRINNFSVLKFVQGIIRGTVRVLLAFK